MKKKKKHWFPEAIGPDGFSPVDPVGFSQNKPYNIIDAKGDPTELLCHQVPLPEDIFGKQGVVELRVKDDPYYTTPRDEQDDEAEPMHSGKYFAIRPKSIVDLLPFAYYTEFDEPKHRKPTEIISGAVTIKDSEDALVATMVSKFENLSLLWPNEVSEAIQRRVLERINKKVPCHYGV